jgi:hypothetical protein
MAIEEEIEKGGEDIPDAGFMFTHHEISKVRGTNLAYKRAWLRNVRGRRKAAQTELPDRELLMMRRIMHRFLHQSK